jgi:hypothetical protein
MSVEDSTQQLQKRWAEQWKFAATALAQQKRKELREMTSEAALAASDALLEIGAVSELSPSRRTSSGLVEQQALSHKMNLR